MKTNSSKLLLCIALLSFIFSASNKGVESEGLEIDCKGSIDVVCAEGSFPDGSTWTAFGDEVVVKFD